MTRMIGTLAFFAFLYFLTAIYANAQTSNTGRPFEDAWQSRLHKPPPVPANDTPAPPKTPKKGPVFMPSGTIQGDSFPFRQVD